MSSIQANTSPTIPPPSTPPTPNTPTSQSRFEKDDLSTTAAAASSTASSQLLDAVKDVRQIIRLAQCCVCSRIVQEPTTLPCGESLCKQCIPQTYVRTNISWPATAGRLQAFKCPFTSCGKEHAVGDCSIDVTVNKVLALFRAALDQDRDVSDLSKLATSVTIHDRWKVAGLPSLEEKDETTKLLKGGRILATYTLVNNGVLEYGTEVLYTSVGAPEAEVSKVDAALFLRLKESVRTEMDCQVCYALYLDPLTTSCGHTFCRNCLQRVLDHSIYCPICRRALTIQPQLNSNSFPSNQRLCQIINGFWADIVALRSQAVRIEQQSNIGDFDIPLFVCTLSFPAMPTFLHVFEPRYRLMIRRAMEADRTFGMVLHKQGQDANPHFHAIGTLLRIVNIEYFPDGRSLLETVGVSRFRVTRHGQLDGYIVGNIDKIDDISLAEEEEMEIVETMRGQGVQDFTTPMTSSTTSQTSVTRTTGRRLSSASMPHVEDLEHMSTRQLLDLSVDFVRRMRAQSVAWLTTRVLAIYGECPTDPAIFPWWLASVLPVVDEEKYRLLGTSSVRERMKICCRWIVEWESSRW
ncbi:ATP-dependent protease La domain-containing protein [Pseudomassariella vexata]|uniref:ATP-dependent protease La domain-containing protein n=1 Tax=Pseudomassariella vexata TaxID=1141098 RepID=A0A1Y2EEE5_9PEZI|nr:ATP-dependent protease La domain-containing protein [Pseudomassariella vexata]ORY69948.1 ATP-dependent protease La domain-containing protein [Pseudomassariella vexata]